MRISIGSIAALALLGGLASAAADETGVAVIHDWRRVGTKICFVDHFHDGSGHASTQNAAMAEAIHSWQDFTALEYGSDWAAYSKAVEKTATCAADSGGFECGVHAIACKSGTVVSTRRHRPVKARKTVHPGAQ